MILAAAACADGKGPPPPELELAWQARAFHTLPEPGGLRDQRAGEVQRMLAALNVFETWRTRQRHTNWAKWARDDPESWRIVSYVQRLRKRHGR